MGNKGRKYRPKWQVQIDAILFRYVDDPMTIRAQQLRVREMQLSGIRTTASYSLREGTPGGENITKEERYILDMEQAREQIEISKERQALINQMLQDHFSKEERQFIELFWLDVPAADRGAIWTRTLMVIHDIGWLRDPEGRNQPGSLFWVWRKRIYDKWWDLLFPDMPKEEIKAEYIEHVVLGEG